MAGKKKPKTGIAIYLKDGGYITGKEVKKMVMDWMKNATDEEFKEALNQAKNKVRRQNER